MPSVTKSKEDVKQLLRSLDEAIAAWKPLLTVEPQDEPSLKSSQVTNPLEELSKLGQLIHAHTTKVGIVYRPPISPENFHACFVEVESVTRSLVMLVSLCSQLIAEKKKYSTLYIQKVLDEIHTLLGTFSVLSNELSGLLDIQDGDADNTRLVSVGKIWEICDNLSSLVRLGASGVLRAKFKESVTLLADGLEEYEEWLESPSADNGNFFGESEDEDETEQTEVDAVLVSYGSQWVQKLKLVKLLFTSMDKNIGKTQHTESISSKLDRMNSERLEIGLLVDEFISAIIYDLDQTAAQKYASQLTKACMSLTEVVSQLEPKKVKWFDTWKTKFLENI
ncbi:hypothetical protein KL928_002702 [Ogataea angusta]|uniref:Cyclin-D1-binding protein 1-like N-terminal domain-containing protein n=1 Tax=Pichia angusta TaxID=870730 RepID=A0AAN6I576_PICAN|nr:uncharacterized protein KL928_002702 [Ogataea angusta]KAG7818834.1 hypothetical protein KL928_002702 [Ogataea angusta]